jgi:penicillin-binding protein 2
MAVKDFNQQRQFVIMGVISLVTLILLFRAAQLQLIDRSYQIKASAITVQRSIKYPSRGVVYDRNNALMVYNNAQYDLMVTYKQVNAKMDVPKFCNLLGIDTATFRTNLEKDWKNKQFSQNIPYAFLTMITPESYARFQELMHEFPGFFIQERNVRGYPQHSAGHILGYQNEVNLKQIKDSVNIYEASDYIGTSGLERYYEGILRGKKGVNFIMKDNLGRLVEPYKEGILDTAAIQGKDLFSSIDLKLQALGEYMMKNKKGAIIAIEPKTGEILAMVTSPTFDPQQLTMGKQRSAALNALATDTLRPLFNRAVSAKYPPGSVFKPMMALIAMQMGVWSKNNSMVCGGGYHYGNRILRCHCGHNCSNMAEAIEHSCNTYFCGVYRAMIDRYGLRTPKAGLDSLNSYVYRFGMGNALGIDYPYENKGFIPTSATYDKRYKRDGFWYSTYFVSNAIGQGENQLTTIQMANLAAIIANKGWYITPHLIKGYKDSTNQTNYNVLNNRFVTKNYTGVDAQHFDYVIDGMRRVILSGTGNNAQIPGVDICGKTGTSENNQGEDSSVFIGFAPKNDPKIAIAVYVENGGWGNDFAAPMTGLMIEQWLNGRIAENRKSIVEKMNRARYAYSSGKGFYVQKGY